MSDTRITKDGMVQCTLCPAYLQHTPNGRLIDGVVLHLRIVHDLAEHDAWNYARSKVVV